MSNATPQHPTLECRSDRELYCQELPYLSGAPGRARNLARIAGPCTIGSSREANPVRGSSCNRLPYEGVQIG